MIDVYFWPTGNGKKITIMLEECELPYNVVPANNQRGRSEHTGIRVLEWVYWQVGGLGPMAGQAHHRDEDLTKTS